MRKIGSFFGASEGGIAILFALSAVPLCFAIGMAIDFGTWLKERSQLQSMADQAALKGAMTLAQNNGSAQAALSAALLSAQANGQGTINNYTPTVTVDSAQGSVQVALALPGHRTLSALMLQSDPTIRVTSRARIVGGSPASQALSSACVLALDSAMQGALEFSGGGLLQANNCTVQVNSNSSKAVNFSGNSKLQSGKNCFVGGVDQGLSLMTPAPILGCPAEADPFAGYPTPAVGSCTFTNFKVSGGSPILSPGIYCGGLTLSSVTTATLQPGLYIIKDGLFTMSGGGALVGNGITLFLTGSNAGLNWSGGGSYKLVAPQANQPGIPGFVVFLDPTAAEASKSVISGTGQMYYEGILYFPTQEVEISGTGMTQALASPYSIYIANNFIYSGSSQLYVNADPSKTSVYIPPEVVVSQGGSGSAILY